VAEYDLLSEAFYKDPHAVLAEMRRKNPCWFDHRLGAYVVTRYGDVSRILQDDDFSAQRVGQFTRGAPEHLRGKVKAYVDALERWPLFIDPPHHTRLRARLQRAFGPALLPTITNEAKQAVRNALEEIDGAACIDAIARFAYPVPTGVLAKVFGISDNDIERFKRWTTEIFALIGAGVADEQAVEAGYRGVMELRDYVLRLLDEKRRAPGNDMLSALAAPPDGEGDVEVGEEDLIGLFMSMIVAGHETSTNLIGNALRAVMLDRTTRDRVIGPADLPEAAIDEFVRYDGPVASMLRMAKRQVVIAGTVVPEGSFLFSMLLSANRDPRKFPAPDRLDLDRPLSAHVGFGVGRHRCVGAFMARVVAREAVQSFMRRFPNATVAEGCVWHRNTSFRGLRAMPAFLGPSADREFEREA
jgi:cytochrome P450